MDYLECFEEKRRSFLKLFISQKIVIVQYYNNLNIARHKRVHNEVIVENMLYFYNFAMRYLDGGKLGGIRIYAKK